MNPCINCKTRDVVYSIRCMEGECKNTSTRYIGETSHSIAERIDEHWREYNDMEPTSLLFQHAKDRHLGKIDNIQARIISKHMIDLMLRHIKGTICKQANVKTNRSINKKNSSIPF